MDDQAQGAVEERSIHDRILAVSQPEQPEVEEIPGPETAEEVAVEEGADAVPEAVEEAVLTPEQLEHYKVRVKIDGEESEVSLKEAREGYQREADYRKKTQELAKERAEIPKKVREEVEKKAQEYQQNVRVFQQALANLADQELTQTDWNKLANEDPAEFVKKMHRKTQFENFLRAAQQEIQKQDEARKQEIETQQAQALEQAQARLKSSIPGWGDELAGKITKSALHYGFSKEELSGITDARYVEVLHDAMQFRELKDKKSLVDKKVAEVPKVLKPGTQQSKTLVNSEREKELKAAVKKSGGRSEDVVALLFYRQKQARR
jgi:hypothetical protein